MDLFGSLDFGAASYAETTTSLNFVHRESFNNASFVAAPFFLYYMMFPYIMTKDMSYLLHTTSKLTNKVWHGSSFTTDMDTIPQAIMASFSSYEMASVYDKWIFDKKTNETVRNPMTIEMRAKEANEKISNATKGQVNGLLRPSDFEGGAIVYHSVNRLEATWKNKFDPSETFKGSFHSSQNSERNVDFMSLNGVKRNYSENEHFQMLSLPYEWNTDMIPMMEMYNLTMSMNIFLPKTRFGLHKALKTLKYDSFEELLTSAKETIVKTTIPKFRMDTEFNCEAFYKKLGLGEFLYNGTTKSESEEREEWDKYYRAQNNPTIPALPERPYNFRARSLIGMDENGSNTGAIPEIPIESTFVKLSHPKDVKKQKKLIADHPFMFVVTSGMHPVLVGTQF